MRSITAAALPALFLAALGLLSPGIAGEDAPAPRTPEGEAGFTLSAIGDTGSLTQELYDNAVGVTREIERAGRGQRALMFLGDNFYTYGLSRDPIPVREKRYRAIYEDLFGSAMRTLSQDACAKDESGTTSADCPAGPVNYVHAVAGNHDYYSGALSFAGLSVLPTGFSTEGNEYCRVRGRLTVAERDALEAKSRAPLAPPPEGTPAKPAKPEDSWDWRYHFDLPQHEYWPIDPNQPDSPEIHVVFFDSALLVRAAENCGNRPLQCPGPSVDEDDPDNPLACARAHAALCRLKEHLDSEKSHPRVRWRVFVAHHPFWTVGAHGGYLWSAVEGEAVWSNQCLKAVDPQGWFKNTQFDPEDECSHGWKWYVDHITQLMKGRPPFDFVLAGHDHSLQLIQPAEKDTAVLARLQIVSGAGAKTSVVRGPGPRLSPRPRLEHVFTAATRRQSESRHGYVALRFYADRAQVQFFEGWKALPASAMAQTAETKAWEGKSCFPIGANGLIDPAADCQW